MPGQNTQTNENANATIRWKELSLDVIAGVALGCLVGVLIGLSASPVVASAVAALLALLSTFLGFGGLTGNLSSKVGAARLVGFGFSMTAAFVGGIALRAHGTLGPSFKERIQRFSVENIDLGRAYDLAIYEHTGLISGHLIEAKESEAPIAVSAHAFNNKVGDMDPNCVYFGERYTQGTDARLKAMEQSVEPWASFGRIGRQLPEDSREKFATVAFNDHCNSRRQLSQ